MTPDTLLRGNRSRWEAEGDTWNAFAGFPCQVGGKRCYLTRFRGISVPGGRRDGTPDTLLRDFRGRWKAGWDTWNALAGKLCQVGGKRCYLTRFRRETVPGGRRDMPPGTLLRDFRARWRRDETPGTLLRGFRARWETGKTT